MQVWLKLCPQTPTTGFLTWRVLSGRLQEAGLTQGEVRTRCFERGGFKKYSGLSGNLTGQYLGSYHRHREVRNDQKPDV